jgi:hypothetical protein
MDLLVLLLIVLLLFGGGGWVWTSGPNYTGPAVGGWLAPVIVLIVVVLILRLLGVV